MAQSLSRMHALIIGVSRYAHKMHSDIEGCVPDAIAMKRYLEQFLGVPEDNILCLLDEQATRRGIINAFFSHLINNTNIQYLDPIVVYFAGHGARVSSPFEWHSSDGLCGLILPHDASWSDIRQDVENDIPPSKRKYFVHGIHDRKLESLIHVLHGRVGDNIVSTILPEQTLRLI
ncbi:hypothetical protein BDV93DRAFT_454439 [Ceratobasidium sp. AG-I]|nr:hypothetical protein BDV93DRAFT_454439 [Ceratobasidium sp. AG-I]